MRFARLRLRRVQLLLALLLALSLFPLGTALADNFNTTNFRVKWERADKPVADGTANPSRSWLWGPEAYNPPNNATTEAYADSPGGNRQVQYFDKARMEINNPANGLVTNGLLVRELISGRLATGDVTFTQRRAADDIPVAGDPTNNSGPTYASFAKVASLNSDNASTPRIGSPVDDTISKDGTLGTDSNLGKGTSYVYFDQALKHNVPDVFWKFMNQRGTIYQNGQLSQNQPVLGDNSAAPWLDATGLPITEAYWAKVTLAGQQKDVLIQAFERRVLTYTPSNPAAFQVEMGNVGRHYYNWRYDTKYDNVTTPPASGSCESLPANNGGAFAWISCGPAGLQIVVERPAMLVGELVDVSYTRGDGSTNQFKATVRSDGLALIAINSSSSSPQGKWTFNFKGETSGLEGTAYFFMQPPVSKPTIIVYPTTSSVSQDITIALLGFGSNELIGVGFQAPVAGSKPIVSVLNVNSEGGFTGLFKIREIFKNYPQYLVPGTWVVFATNKDESHTASANFTVTK